MKERPILFSGPMVRAILDGRKAQTRRVVKPQPIISPGAGCERLRLLTRNGEPWVNTWLPLDERNAPIVAACCPYGVPGDLLWVKETWRSEARHDAIRPTAMPPGALVSYDADYTQEPNDGCRGKTRVSIHMPRWASRITLRITDVRVERLQDISEADAIAEGLEWRDDCGWGVFDGDLHICGGGEDPKDAYRCLWVNINGPGSWDANPFVWVVEFERVPA